jgi:hypothetical protein
MTTLAADEGPVTRENLKFEILNLASHALTLGVTCLKRPTHALSQAARTPATCPTGTHGAGMFLIQVVCPGSTDASCDELSVRVNRCKSSFNVQASFNMQAMPARHLHRATRDDKQLKR